MNLFSTILAVNFVLLWCQFEHSQQQKKVSGCQSLFAKIIFHPEVLLNAVQLRSPPAALVHCALILNIDEWKILKIPRIPAANSLLPHFRASVYTNLFTLSIIIACSNIRSHYHHYREIITSRGIDWNTCFDFITDFWHCDTCHAAVSRGHAVTHYTRDIRDIVTIAGCGSLTGAGQWHMRPWCPLVSPLCLIVTTPVTVSITDSGMRSGIDPLFITNTPTLNEIFERDGCLERVVSVSSPWPGDYPPHPPEMTSHNTAQATEANYTKHNMRSSMSEKAFI